MLRLALTPRWILGLLLVLSLASGFVLLSSWQLNASTLGQVREDPLKEQVRPYQDLLQAASPLDASEVDSMLQVTGNYQAGSSYLVAGKRQGEQEGYWVVSLFTPSDSHKVTTSLGEGPRGLAVVRGWTEEPLIPAEPQGEVTLAGRLVGNEAPASFQSLTEEDRGWERILPSVASFQLTNIWNAALFNGIILTQAETTGQLTLTPEGNLAADSQLLATDSSLEKVTSRQVTDETVDWLNIFYALEWLIFAAFALYLWWRLLKDAAEKEADPALYYEYEGVYWVDEATGRPYYYDPQDKAYYFFDQDPDQVSKTVTKEGSEKNRD